MRPRGVSDRRDGDRVESQPAVAVREPDPRDPRRRARPDRAPPASLPLDGKKFFPSGGPKGAGYELSIGLVKNCGDATACFSADFLATKGGKVYGTPVTVKGASKAGYRGNFCGASCSPAQVDFVVGGFLYTIQANVLTKPRTTLIAASQSAIAAGAR